MPPLPENKFQYKTQPSSLNSHIHYLGIEITVKREKAEKLTQLKTSGASGPANQS